MERDKLNFLNKETNFQRTIYECMLYINPENIIKEIISLKEEKISNKGIIKKLNESIYKLENKNQKQKIKIKQFKQKNAQLKNKIINSNENKGFNTQIQVELEYIKKLNEELKTKNIVIENYKKDKEKNDEIINNYLKENTELKVKIKTTESKYEAKLSENNQENDDLKQNYLDIIKQLEDKKNMLNKTLELNNRLSNEEKILKEKLIKLENEKNENINNIKNIFNKKYNILLEEKNQILKEFENSKKELMTIKSENNNSKINLNNTKINLNQLKEENNQLKQNIEKRNQNENELKIKFKQINDELKKHNEMLKNREIEYNNKIGEYKKIIEKYQKDINEIQIIKRKVEEKEKEINEEASSLKEWNNFIEKEKYEMNNYKIEFEKDKEENIKIKQENNILIQKNKNLEKIIKENQSIYNKIISNLKEKSNIQKSLIQSFNIINERKNNLKNMEINLTNSFSFNKNIETKPVLIGLNNIGATCFMNSTLQCLSQTKALTDYFLNPKNENIIINNNIAINNKKENKNDLQLSPVYLDLIKKLWDKNGPSSFSPTDFRIRVEQMNPLFKQGQPGDSKDFIIFILEQIHKELKRPNKNNIKISNEIFNQYDKNNAFNHFFYDFNKELSVISNIFFGFNETTNECLYCKNYYNSQGYNNPICYNYGIFNCIIFPLEEVKNMKNNYMQNSVNYNNVNNNIQNNTVTIYECFQYNQKTELFSGENRNYCNNCKQLYDSFYISKIFSSSNILILILNRGKGNIFNVKLEFTETIDLTQFVIQKDKPQMIYELYGVITHIGQSGPNAHFVASCKSQIDKKWYRFNDAFVNPITDFQKEVINFGTPYILFYQKY